MSDPFCKDQKHMSDYLLLDNGGYATLNLNESHKGGPTVFTGIFSVAETVNQNKRKYKKSILEQNVNRLQKFIDQRALISSLDHPDTSVVKLETACAVVTKLWWEGNELWGNAEVLNTPNGKVLKALLESNITVGVSTRGVGSGTTNADGVLEINDNYNLVTFDIVNNPSEIRAIARKVESVSTINSENIQIKNETASLNKVNVNTLISFMGHMINKESQLIRENLNND
jgi:hypothetical protein